MVEYQGRGHEHFYEEIQRIFDWMGRRHRDFFPKKITAASHADLGQLLLVAGTGRLSTGRASSTRSIG